MRRFAKPLYGLTPVPRVRIPPSPPLPLLSSTCKLVIPTLIPSRWRITSEPPKCNLTKRIQTRKGLRYCPVVLSANGRIKPDVVLVNGREERHPEGAYYLEWYEGKRRIRLSVGKDAATATARRLRKEAELNAVNNGVTVLPDGQNGHRSVAAAVADFLDETEAHQEAQDAGRVHDCSQLLHRVLPKALPRRHRPQGSAQVLRHFSVMRRSRHRALSTTNSRT